NAASTLATMFPKGLAFAPERINCSASPVQRKLTAELGFMGAKPINRLVNAGMPSHQPTSARAPTMMAIEALTRATRLQVKARDDVEATAGEGISLPLQLLPYHYNYCPERETDLPSMRDPILGHVNIEREKTPALPCRGSTKP